MPQRVKRADPTTWLAVWAIFCACAPSVGAADAPPGGSEFFEMRIRPLLAKRCFTCHTSGKMGGLEMSGRNALLKGGGRGPAISPDHPEESLLLRAVSYKLDALKMPPTGKLPENEIEELTVWVKSGAVWPESAAPPASKDPAFVIAPEQRAFWAFQPVRKPALPDIKDSGWAKSAIDRLLQAKRESQHLEPVKPADRLTLLRRAYYDLIGLPPAPEQVDAFLRDPSPGAFAKVVDQLLASPRYGERWGRYWLDVARYSDDKLDSEIEDPYPNAYRYRDWVIKAFNDDMPYNQFVKAQIAGDLLGDDARYATGLGFYALRPKAEGQEDRVDATTRGFLALTAGCAECHNHKFDPIPTTDYYALLGVFTSTEDSEFHLAPEAAVKKYKEQEKKVQDQEARIRDFLYTQATQLATILASQSPRYLRAARAVLGPSRADAAQAAQADHLDRETLERWVRYLESPKDHHYLDNWQDEKFDLERFRQQVLAVLDERKKVDETNAVIKAESKKAGPKTKLNVVSLKTESYYLWRDLFFNDFYGNQFKQEDDGVLYYGPNRGYVTSDGTVERFLSGPWKEHLDSLRAELAALKLALPPPYPFAHTIKDAAKLKVERVRIGGVRENPGEAVPHHFLSILSDGEPRPFEKGSGRLELADAITNARNPLTARVMVNRIWQRHFGAGIVRTPSDFGRMGDRPSDPELLDYLANRFIENGWSVKALHREIMLSATYALSSDQSAKNMRIDPENRLLWRANIQRLDAEALRDSLLFVSGELDVTAGGPPQKLNNENNRRRTVYGFVSRNKLDGMLALFDFPNPNITSEKRNVTESPAQELFFLNSTFIERCAQALVRRVGESAKRDDVPRIEKAYRILFGRAPVRDELRLGEDFLKVNQSDGWQSYAQALLNSNEFLFVN